VNPLIEEAPTGKYEPLEMEVARKFFDEFARSKNFDPLDAEQWYSITKTEIQKMVNIDPNYIKHYSN
jgi:hypothetical protein